MSDAELLARKKKVRGGHRSTIKRLLESTKVTIEKINEANADQFIAELTQLKLSLIGKQEVLKELDDLILDKVKEDEIDAEIEQADLYNERIIRALIDIEAKLPSQASASVITTCQTISTNHDASNLPSQESSISSKPKMKLPKYQPQKFKGNVTEWNTFWDSYEAAVHNNEGLADIEKFTYLRSFLEGEAAAAISGLALTANNYKEAIELLKKRFGNKQTIINKHMDNLLELEQIKSVHDLKGLRKLYDKIETEKRGLKGMGVTADSYGNLLVSVVMNKLPQDLRLIISRKVKGEEEWNLDSLLTVFEEELEARERASKSDSKPELSRDWKGTKKDTPTVAFLTSGNQTSKPTCTYCKGAHPSASCNVVTNIKARKEILKKTGRCYVCLRRNHVSRECNSTMKCVKCGQRHHLSIHMDIGENRSNQGQGKGQAPQQTTEDKTATMYVKSGATPILLQTASTTVINPGAPDLQVNARVLFDTGSQRSYITSELKERLNLPTLSRQDILVKTFGSMTAQSETVDVVELNIRTPRGENIPVTAYAVPLICEPLQGQCVSEAVASNPHLSGLRLAEHPTEGNSDGTVDILIGSDQYWNFVTGNVARGEEGPTAIHTKLGWVLSGPLQGTVQGEKHFSNLVVTHSLKCAAQPVNVNETLEQDLKKFWELESIGIKSQSLYDEVTEAIAFKNGRYEVSLPWKSPHPLLPDNFELCKKRLTNLLQHLRREPEKLKKYDTVIREQQEKGIIEKVQESSNTEVGEVHYLPHRAVVKEDRSTTKLRVVFDASARSSGPSLNDCLYVGPSLTQNIFDIILRFRAHRYGFAADIEKAFHMVAVSERDRDVLRFLWIDDIENQTPQITVFRFARVVFGVSSSPFLLNATIKYHIERFKEVDPEFVKKFMNSIYVDDLSCSAENVNEAYKMYVKSKFRLAEGGFNLRKFVTNSSELREKIRRSEQPEFLNSKSIVAKVTETGESSHDQRCESHMIRDVINSEDTSYTKSVLGSTNDLADDQQKILGVLWNFANDVLVFDLKEIACLAKNLEPKKRNVVKVSASFYDPLGYMSPVIVLFKLFFQELCKNKIDWDEIFEGELRMKWNKLVSGLQNVEPLTLPRCYLYGITNPISSYSIHGFCDSSKRAYAAVIYLCVTTTCGRHVKFLASKTRVAPVVQQSIPRLELLSALILARLVTTVINVLQDDFDITETVCWTDSRGIVLDHR